MIATISIEELSVQEGDEQGKVAKMRALNRAIEIE